MNEHFTINAGKNTTNVFESSNEISYMALSASLAMDLHEEGFFENFHITDKFISGKQELLLDAYAFIETESTKKSLKIKFSKATTKYKFDFVFLKITDS